MNAPFLSGIGIGVFTGWMIGVFVFAIIEWRPWKAERIRLRAEISEAKEALKEAERDLEKANRRASGWAQACSRSRASLLKVETDITAIRSGMESDQMPSPATKKRVA